MSFVDRFMDINEAYENFKESLQNAVNQGVLDEKSATILQQDIATYVSSMFIMSNYTEDKIRKIILDKLHNYRLIYLIYPVYNGEVSDMQTIRIRTNIIKSAIDLISASLMRGLYGRERDKFYGTMNMQGRIEEGGVSSPFDAYIQNDEGDNV